MANDNQGKKREIAAYMISFPIANFWAFIPSPPTIPSLYWDVYSNEQRIKAICEQIEKLTQYSNLISEAVNQLNDDMSENNAELIAEVNEQLANQQAEIDSQLAQLKAYVDKALADISASTYVWNPLTGTNTNSKRAMRDMFFATTEYGIEIRTFNGYGLEQNLTCEQLANCGLNCRGLASIGYAVFDSAIFRALKYTDNGLLPL